MTRSLKKEVLRKFIHLLEVPVVIGYALIRHFWSQRIALLTLTVLFLLLLEIEYIRLEVKPKIPHFLNIFRKHERNNVTSAIFFIAATIIVFSVFDYAIALLAILLTVFGDLFSALLGIKFGKHKLFRQKTWEGFFGGLSINILVGFLLLPQYPAIFLPMAFIASIVELLTGKLDDNLTVPLFAGGIGQLIAYFLQANLNSFPQSLEGLFYFFS